MTAELAAQAGVAVSTVSRIEKGTVSPTTATLEKSLHAAGADLILSFSSRHQSQPIESKNLATIADAWKRSSAFPDLRPLRILIDWIGQDASRARAATKRPPAPLRSKALEALLAGVAEKISDDFGLPRPSWTRAIPGLQRTWALPATPSMRRRQILTTPEQRAARGLVLDERSLWRDPETVTG